jgi:hypothetical protein
VGQRSGVLKMILVGFTHLSKKREEGMRIRSM